MDENSRLVEAVKAELKRHLLIGACAFPDGHGKHDALKVEEVGGKAVGRKIRCGTCSVLQHVAVRQLALAIPRLLGRRLQLRLRRDTCGLCRAIVSLERTRNACVSKARMNVCRLAHH